MPAQFIAITKHDMDIFMSEMGFKQIELAHVFEHVYARAYVLRDTPFSISIRVYSSISNRQDHARDVGTDAIRVCVVAKRRDNANHGVFFLGKSRRVNRTEGWRKNLKQRLDNWRDLIDMRCNVCGYPMVIRHNRITGQAFYGCIRYYTSGCTYTAPHNCDHADAAKNATVCPSCRSFLTKGDI